MKDVSSIDIIITKNYIMRIRIDGTNTVNKGAELMLYAILDKINQFDRKAIIEFNMSLNDSYKDCSNIKTELDLRILNRYKKIFFKFKVPGILKRLGLPHNFLHTFYLNKNHPKIDLLLDASGFKFSDQWNMDQSSLDIHSSYYNRLKKQGTFIVFLPQAFGPFKSNMGEKSAKMLVEYSDLIFARDIQSYNYFIEAGCDTKKVLIYPDFTSTINGDYNNKYKELIDGIGIIPNKRMIDRGGLKQGQYILFLNSIIKYLIDLKHKPYLLNHESEGDSKLCNEINSLFNNRLPIVDNANALDVKGVISNSHMIISSRYHGVASALNSGVPCLATSWSHKYKELFNDFEQYDCLINVDDIEESLSKIEAFLEPEKTREIKKILLARHQIIKSKNEEMWELIWKKYNNRIN